MLLDCAYSINVGPLDAYAHGLRQRDGNGAPATGWSVILAMPAITVVMMIPALTMILASMMTPIIMIVIRNDAATQTNYDQACD
jgi:hypothetical protein